MPMNNLVIETNKLTDLVALRTLVASGYLTVGSKAHFKDQLIGKRNGQTYGFVLKDAGIATNSLDASSDTKTSLTEQIVNLSLEPWHIYLKSNAVEGVTDVRWDDEIAKPNGAKLANGMVRDAINKNFTKAAVSIVGEGFQPLAEAAAHLSSQTSEKLFGFTDPKIQAVLTANGQQFNPVGSPDSFYKQGLLGEFHSVEYRAQRFFPSIKVDATLAGKIATTTAALSITEAGVATVTLASGATAAEMAGLPVMIPGVYACDINGDPTNNLFSFIVPMDATGSSFTVDGIFAMKGGTMTICDSTGDEVGTVSGTAPNRTWALSATAIEPIAAGTYFIAQVRADGAFEFETLDKLDVSNADSKVGSVEGVTVHENRVIDLEKMLNGTRWDIVALYGTVEKRAVVNCYFKG
jgi:hypothetical protein